MAWGKNILVASLLQLGSLGASLPVGQAAPDKAVEIQADHFSLDLVTRSSQFNANVRIQFDNYRITCQQARVYMEPKQPKISRIIMSGKVRIERDGAIFQGQTVTWEVKQQRLSVQGPVYSRIPGNQLPPVKLNLR